MAALEDDVKKFAAELGFASAGANGFHDADFAPEHANKRAAGTQREAGRRKRETRPGREPPQTGKQDRKAGSVAKSRYAASNTGPDGSRDTAGGRQWKSSAGPRPGDGTRKGTGKGLLGRELSGPWHQALARIRPSDTGADDRILEAAALERLRNDADTALANEATTFEQNLGMNRADSKWLQQVKQAGTTADRLAAMTLLIQDSAVSNLKNLDELLRWVGKRSGARAPAGQAIDALKELFVTTLLPERKLLFFEQQPLARLPKGKEGRQCLLLFYFEDALKKRYLEFVKSLQQASRDNLEFIKLKALKAIYDLLRSRPEQEGLLLETIVDKLGDPTRKVASDAGYLLGQLLEEHPAMSMVVAQEAERFVFKPHLPARAVYYTVIFLNQLVLYKRSETCGSGLAKRLIGTYFTLFHLIMEGKVGHLAELRAQRDEAQAVGKKKGKGKKTFKKSRPQKHGSRVPARPRGKPSRAQPGEQQVDAKLLAALLAGVRRAFPFVDEADLGTLTEQHSPALFRVTHTATFGVAVQALALLFQLLDARSAVSDRYYRSLYSVLLSEDVARSNKTTMFLSLLFKSMRADVSEKRVLAFVKRLLQIAVEQMPNFACGSLLLVSELIKVRPLLWSAIDEAEEAGDGVERFKDAPEEDGPAAADELLTPPEIDDADQELPRADQHARGVRYDVSQREPLRANAQRSCLWELVPLAGHVHPSVASMAKTLMAGMPIDYLGDPMRDYTTTAFLDKFMQKKAKAKERGVSHMERKTRLGEVTASTSGFAELAAASDAPDAAFFHKFYEVKAQRERAGLRPRSSRRKVAPEAAPLEADNDDDDEPDFDGSDSDSEGMDHALDLEEDFEDGAGDYEGLAAAMRADASDREATPAEIDSEGEALGSENDLSDAATDSGSSLPSPNAGSEEDSDEFPEDGNVFELAGPSEEESESIEDGDDASDGDDSAWIMAEGAKHLLRDDGNEASPGPDDTGMEGRRKSEKSAASKSSRAMRGSKKRSSAVFASVSDYADLIEEDAMQPRPDRKRRK